MRTRIGECLVHAGLISEQDLRGALAERERSGDRLGSVLVRMNLATEEQIADALAAQLGFPRITLSDNFPDPIAISLIPKEVALTWLCVGVSLEKNVLTVAMADPLLFSLVQDLEFQTKRRIRQTVATRGEILAAIHHSYPEPASTQLSVAAQAGDHRADAVPEPIDRLRERAESAPIVELVERIMRGAIESGATEIHVEPTEGSVSIRYRLDGFLKEVMHQPTSMHAALVARLKLMTGMDIAEMRLPQTGRLVAPSGGGLRASTLRTLFGEKIVLRVVDRRRAVPRLDELGLSAKSLETLHTLMQRQHGMIVAAGPAGSGRTTTLCSAISTLASAGRNVVTVEDSVDYQLPGVTQTQTDEAIGLTCARALQSALEQGADVILVGEIRDADCAALAMQAHVDHLLLSTLRADDASSALSALARLEELGIEPALVGSGVAGVVAQRLVRRLCVHCRTQYAPPADMLGKLGMSDTESSVMLFRAVGCDQCHHTGYRGRIGVFEVMRLNDALRRLIAAGAAGPTIRAQAIADGMVTLGEDALSKVKSGVTTAEELLRVVADVGERRPICSGCGAAVGVDFTVCPSCGSRLGGACPHCGRALQPGWSFCPYCAGGTESARRSGRRPASSNVAEFKKAL